MDRCVSLVKVVERGCKGYKGGTVLAMPGDTLEIKREIAGEIPYFYVSNGDREWFVPGREIQVIK